MESSLLKKLKLQQALHMQFIDNQQLLIQVINHFILYHQMNIKKNHIHQINHYLYMKMKKIKINLLINLD